MRLNNQEKIIYEEDIVLADGLNLSASLQEYKKLIQLLQSNVKWLYKYGGTGKGSGGGGGQPTQSFSIYATLNNIQLKDQSIVLEKPDLYPLLIKINNPNGASFNVKYSYTTKSSTGNEIKQELTVILSIENNYLYETLINLNNNSNLQITVSDGNEVKQVMCSYVTTPYEFTLSLVDDNGDSVPLEHFIETAAKKGVNVKLKYVVSIPANVHYKYTFKDDVKEADISDLNNSILFPINKALFTPENSGYYTANIDFQVIPVGLELINVSESISFSLIPEDLYMLILPKVGIIYNSELQEPFKYTPGYITFDYRIYEGISQNRTYSIDIKLNDTSILTQSVVERLQYTFKLFSVKSGLNTLDIKVSRTSVYLKRYYFYVQESSIVLDWFDKPSEWTSYYYRINEVTDNFKPFKDKLYIEQTVISNPIKISNITPPNVSANALINTHIAIGLQLNSINSEDPVILNFFNSKTGNSPVLSIQQSKISKQGQIANLYIRKQNDANKDTINNYHLILIYSQFVRRIEQSFYYETSLYIDGILENVYGLLSDYPLLADSLQIEQNNCFINLLEVDYKQTEETFINNCDYEVYKYFLKYKNAILIEDVGNELLLLNYIKNFNVGLNGRVTINQADINNIAKNIDTPVLLATYQDDGLFDSMGGFMEALEAGYGEDGTGIGSDMNFLVSVSWGSGNNSVDDIQIPSEFPNARFRMALQGSSTKMYRVKNFNLSIENTTGTELDEVYLYSPNFEEGNISTFLPETEFTLKADVVDSSHSNNTSCGKFINTVCRKFSEDINEDGYYKNYIKNCLEGFPVLVFICHVKTDPITSEVISNYYYLGVYNFNLGRSSYYNLGYKDLSVFGNSNNKLLHNAGNSFTFFKINPSDNVLKQGLGVAEIQGGDPHFDFSQFDPTVLFLQVETDSRYMFGDLVYGSNSTELQLKNSLSKFVEKVAKSGGYLFDFLKKKKGLYETSDVKEGSGYNAEVYDSSGNPTGESKNQVPDYTKLYEKYLAPSGAWEFRLKSISPIQGTQLDLQDLIIPDIDSGKLASLNFLAVSEYYTICMVLGLVDSVMKNLNIKTWNSKPDGTATWYPAFYDMDTCLGINNQGNPISYFAFSDYWHSQIKKTFNDVQYPSAVRIYRDFSPHSLGENGYDVPTNYLFTVAKYAKLIFNDNTSEQSIYLSQYPLELYAKWRSNVENPSTNEGVLKNADKFMENFFANNLASICPALVSYNYRSKYLKLATENDTVWVATDFNKFNGTRVNKVRDWLEGRLHILDVYFNLNRAMPQVITYRTEGGKWETLMNGSAPVVDTMYNSNYDLNNNKDIVILKDIFSANGGTGVQLSGFISFLIKCPEFSPLLIYNQIGSVHENYILGGDKKQLVEFTPTGVQNVKLGGSQAWSYLQDINWITTSGLYITSDKLENITGNNGKFTSLQLKTPNVKTIDLTSRNYSGNLTLDGIDNYPNLTNINISNSLISLNANNLKIKSLNISNMDASNSSVTVTNCGNITSLNTTNTRLRSLHIEGLKGNLKNFTLNNTNINSLIVKCGEIGGTFTILNDLTITSLTIGDFKKVVILNCPKLTRVVLNKETIQTIEELLVLNCTANNLAITSEVTSIDKLITLSNSKLKKVKFENCIGIEEATLPDNVELLPYAFNNCRSLKKLSGNSIYISDGVFNSCIKFTLIDKNNAKSKIKVKPEITSLAASFKNTNILWSDVKYIINTVIPSNNSITNILEMFSYCDLKFDLQDLKDSITNNDYPEFGKLNKVTNAARLFYRDGFGGNICAINKKFMLLGSPAGCDYNNAFYCKTGRENLYIPKDIFSESITKIIRFPFGTWDGYDNYIYFTDETGLPLSGEINLLEILNPGGQSPIKATYFENFRPHRNQTFNWENVFNENWRNLRYIRGVCGGSCSYKGYSNLFSKVPNPIQCFESWSKSTIENETADYYTMYNWDKLCTLSEIFTLDYNRHENMYSNSCEKYISAENYKLLCSKILNSKTLIAISTIFRNLTVIGSLGDWNLGTQINTKIKKAAYAFDGFKNKTSSGTTNLNYLMLDKDFCKVIPSLVNVTGMFKNCKIGNPIPFNLFKKRQEITELVYIKKLEQYLPATLYTYQYTQDMYDMSHLFEECEWSSNALLYSPDLYNVSKVKVIDSEGNSYDEYYTKTIISEDEIIYNKITIKLPTEVTDSLNLQGGYIASVNNIANPVINGDLNKLIIPPDLFYGLKSIIDNTHTYDLSQGVYKALFCRTPLNGIIPDNIFKNNKTVRCDYLWYKLIIIPRLIKTWNTDNTSYKVYLHYPKDYIRNPNLSNAFNSEYIVLSNSRVGEQLTVNYSVVLLLDSIPNSTTNMDNTFNSNIIRLNAIGLLLPNNDHLFNFFAKLTDSNIIFGLDPSYFTLLNMNKLFHSPYIQCTNGNLFVSNFDAAFIKMSNETDSVIYHVGLIGGYTKDAVANTIILPKASKNIPQLCKTEYEVNIDLITDSLNSKQYYIRAGWLIKE